MSHRQNSRISPSSVHCSYRFWTVTLSFCRERSASHEECYRFAGFWEPEGPPLLAGHHIVLQGIRKTSKCELGSRLYGCTESIASCSYTPYIQSLYNPYMSPQMNTALVDSSAKLRMSRCRASAKVSTTTATSAVSGKRAFHRVWD